MIINAKFENENELNEFLVTNKVRVINIQPKTVNNLPFSVSGTNQLEQYKTVLNVWYEDNRKYLFTTMDGVRIFEGMKCWYYNQDAPIGNNILEYRNCNGKAIKGKYFSTKEAAEKYIEENQPKTDRIVVKDKQIFEYLMSDNVIQLQFNTQTNEINIVSYDINHGAVNRIMILPLLKNEITLKF